MIEKPKSEHFEKKEVFKFRYLAIITSLIFLGILFAITLLAFNQLRGSLFEVTGIVLTSVVGVGIVLFALLLYYRKSYRRELEHLQDYKFKYKEFMPHRKHRLKGKVR